MSRDPLIGFELRLDQLLAQTRPRPRQPQRPRERCVCSDCHGRAQPGEKLCRACWDAGCEAEPGYICQRLKWRRGGKLRLAAGARGPRGGRTEVQSLLFARSRWAPAEAKRWAQRNGYKFGAVDVTDALIRLRQADPGKFKRLRTIEYGHGIKAVVGVR